MTAPGAPLPPSHYRFADVTLDPARRSVTRDGHAIELKSHREITIQIGTPITEIPNFTWSAH